MPPRHSRHRLLAGMGLLSLLASLLPLDALLPSGTTGARSVPMLCVLGALLSCGWFLLGYALASLLRAVRESPPPEPTALSQLTLSQMTTEQLFRELERMNRETLLYAPGLTQCGPLRLAHERSETDFSSA